MNRYRNHVLAVGPIAFGLFVAAPAGAASLEKVSSWGASGVPTYVNMYIYVPDKPAAKPPIVVACHACQGNATSYINSIPGIIAAANKNGFIVIVPEATGRNCWDVGSSKSLTHDGGGDTQAIAQMVKYTLSKYSGDASRVYAMGGSSGAMMTQALLAVYPDVFRAGAERAGVPAGCWADGYDAGRQWSNSCAGGNTSKTAKQWGDLVRGMYPGFSGPRPRVALFHGTADGTINYNNFGEAIKEWTDVLGLSATATTTDSPKADHTRQVWKNTCGTTVLEAWSIKGGTHSTPSYDENAILSFFGLDSTGPDPDDACGKGDAGAGGAPGTGGTGGSDEDAGRSKDGGKISTGSGGGEGSGGSRATGSGGSSGKGGATSGKGGATSGKGGGSSGKGGVAATGGKPDDGTDEVGGASGTGGSKSSGSAGASKGSSSKGGNGSGGKQGGEAGSDDPGAGGSAEEGDAPASGGCAVVSASHAGRSLSTAAALLLALGLISRRQRRARH